MEVLEIIKEYIPIPVLLATFICIMLVFSSQKSAGYLEDYLEKKYDKQISFFDHKKIWLTLFWCIVLAVTLAVGKFITWQESFFYAFCIMGLSSFLYNAFFKKYLKDNENEH